MFFSSQKKREMVLSYYKAGNGQIDFEELKKKSFFWNLPITFCQNKKGGCGDVFYLLTKKKNNRLDEILFSGHQSCLISVSTGSLLNFCLKGKEIKEVNDVIVNFQLMIWGKKGYFFDSSCSDIKMFEDIFKFPHRVGCVDMVLIGIRKGLGNFEFKE